MWRISQEEIIEILLHYEVWKDESTCGRQERKGDRHGGRTATSGMCPVWLNLECCSTKAKAKSKEGGQS